MKALGLLFTVALMFSMVIVGCESKAPSGDAEKAAKTQEAAETEEAGDTEEARQAQEDKAKGAETALKAPSDSPGRMENDEGVSHYDQDHWDVAEVHFRKAVEADPSLAVAHFNLALALDKLNKHGEATQHFKKALELAPDDPKIAQSNILKAHVGM